MTEHTSPGRRLRHSIKLKLVKRIGILTGGGEISGGFLAIHLDNRVAEVEVGDWVLVRELPAEEFRQVLHLDFVNLLYVEPGAAAGDDERPARVGFDLL